MSSQAINECTLDAAVLEAHRSNFGIRPCKYAAKCRDKSAEHRKAFAHPCEYGAKCYRKNPEHLRECIHPPTAAPATTATETAANATAATATEPPAATAPPATAAARVASPSATSTPRCPKGRGCTNFDVVHLQDCRHARGSPAATAFGHFLSGGLRPCKYGPACTAKKDDAAHLAQYSHLCWYGARCTNTAASHRRKFIHVLIDSDSDSDSDSNGGDEDDSDAVETSDDEEEEGLVSSLLRRVLGSGTGAGRGKGASGSGGGGGGSVGAAGDADAAGVEYAGRSGKRWHRRSGGSKSEEDKAAGGRRHRRRGVRELDKAMVEQQAKLGAQSLRGSVTPAFTELRGDHHAIKCFEAMLHREKQLAPEYAVFYHSYSFIAMLYEVNAALANVLFKFKSEFSSLPRLLKTPFDGFPDAAALMREFPAKGISDHDPRFRAVGISAVTSLLAADSEATMSECFMQGYSCTDLSFRNLVVDLLRRCGVPNAATANHLTDEIVKLASDAGLDTSQYGGGGCRSGRAGCIMQIFIHRSIVDKLVYAALPYGVVDASRMPIGQHLAEARGAISGQVRIVAHPSAFMRANAVRLYTHAADPHFNSKRVDFQNKMVALLQPVIGTPDRRAAAAAGVYGGHLPKWWSAEECNTSALNHPHPHRRRDGGGGSGHHSHRKDH